MERARAAIWSDYFAPLLPGQKEKKVWENWECDEETEKGEKEKNRTRNPSFLLQAERGPFDDAISLSLLCRRRRIFFSFFLHKVNTVFFRRLHM